MLEKVRETKEKQQQKGKKKEEGKISHMKKRKK